VPGGPPAGVSAPSSREDAPEWPDFSVVVGEGTAIAPPATVGVVVRDAANEDAVLGRCCIRVAATVTEGWFPLNADVALTGAAMRDAGDVDSRILSQGWGALLGGNSSTGGRSSKEYSGPSAEVFVRMEWPEYCSHPEFPRTVAHATQSASSIDDDVEMRCVSERPGRFFRCGELLVTVHGLGVPVALRDPQLVIKLPDQRLRGFEITAPLPHIASSASEAGESDVDLDVDQTFRPVLDDQAPAVGSASKRRDIKFGSFSFALFQGTFPEELHVGILERGRAIPKIAFAAENTVLLPKTIPGFNATLTENRDSVRDGISKDGELANTGEGCAESSHDHVPSYVIHVLASSPGTAESKISFDVRICYVLWKPIAMCNMVTPRFLSLFAEFKSDLSAVKARCSAAKELTFLFVGGLFTDHYPMYYADNINFLRDVLGLSNIHSVKIHTEETVESNAKVIEQSILEHAQGRHRSVVLVGHSKGGVDVCSAIARFSDLKVFVFGVIAFQAPFSGTFLVDFLRSKSLAQNMLTNTIQNLWGGDGNSVLDIGYDSRFRDVMSCGSAEESTANTPGDKAAGRKDYEFIDNNLVSNCLRTYAKIPIVAFCSSASFSVRNVRTVANAAGFASMAPLARLITRRTGFCCDGLVSPCDARIPYADVVQLEDMMHTEPALYFKGSKYAPGLLTAAAIVLLLEKINRREEARAQESPL
jgi:triacylglycerol lipase